MVNHNKRRHRSSPHRTIRKHRQTCAAGPSHSHTRSSLASTSAPRPPCSPPNPQQPEQSEGTQEAEGELEAGYNSGDEYVPPKHPENIQEVRKLLIERVVVTVCHVLWSNALFRMETTPAPFGTSAHSQFLLFMLQKAI